MSKLTAFAVFGTLTLLGIYVIIYQHHQSGAYHVLIRECNGSQLCWMWHLIKHIFLPKPNEFVVNVFEPFAYFFVILYLDCGIRFADRSIFGMILVSTVVGLIAEGPIGAGMTSTVYFLTSVL
jgi:hypothetical protein